MWATGALLLCSLNSCCCSSMVTENLLVLARRAATTRAVSSCSQRCLSAGMQKVGACRRFASWKARQVRARAVAPSCRARQEMSSSNAAGRSSSEVAEGAVHAARGDSSTTPSTVTRLTLCWSFIEAC
ncbi:hypothetical protein V8C86DRAFT_2972521, partial [Haematococcus lacustris]